MAIAGQPAIALRGLGASVAVVADGGAVLAEIGDGAAINGADAVALSADADRSLEAIATGAAVGAVAIGA